MRHETMKEYSRMLIRAVLAFLEDSLFLKMVSEHIFLSDCLSRLET